MDLKTLANAKLKSTSHRDCDNYGGARKKYCKQARSTFLYYGYAVGIAGWSPGLEGTSLMTATCVKLAGYPTK